jgi:hypothetical protein
MNMWTIQVSGLIVSVGPSSRKTMPTREMIAIMRTWVVTTGKQRSFVGTDEYIQTIFIGFKTDEDNRIFVGTNQESMNIGCVQVDHCGPLICVGVGLIFIGEYRWCCADKYDPTIFIDISRVSKQNTLNSCPPLCHSLPLFAHTRRLHRLLLTRLPPAVARPPATTRRPPPTTGA